MTDPVDLARLREIAEKAPANWWTISPVLADISPATILALLDEIDRLKERIEVERAARREENAIHRSRIEELEKELAATKAHLRKFPKGWGW